MSVLGACASVPNVDKYIDNASLAGAQPAVVGAAGPLTTVQSAAVLHRVKAQANGTDLLARHLAIEQAIAGNPLVAGNKTMVLRDGGRTLKAMFSAIHRARHYINLEYYVFEDVECDGEHLGDLLIAKRRTGVAVSIIYDGFGSVGTPSAFFKRLSAAGIVLLEYNPVNPVAAIANNYSVNDRDHRKILIVDGSLAIIGGVNMSTAYQRNPLGKLVGSGGTTSDYWRDTDLEIEGPAVAELQRLFLQHWSSQQGPTLVEPDPSGKLPPMGKEIVRIIGSSSSDAIPRYYATLLSAIRNADKSIWLTTAYFVPTEDEVDDLCRAAKRGVDVRLLLPSKSDSDRALAVGHSNYGELLEAGVRIYEMRNEVVHSKTVVIDGVWSVIGSSNFDHRSVLFNDEVDVVVLGRNTGQQLQMTFQQDLRDARSIDLATWENRPFPEKLDETFSSVWQNLL
jgi:cardiolipin synthase A/B